MIGKPNSAIVYMADQIDTIIDDLIRMYEGGTLPSKPCSRASPKNEKDPRESSPEASMINFPYPHGRSYRGRPERQSCASADQVRQNDRLVGGDTAREQLGDPPRPSNEPLHSAFEEDELCEESSNPQEWRQRVLGACKSTHHWIKSLVPNSRSPSLRLSPPSIVRISSADKLARHYGYESAVLSDLGIMTTSRSPSSDLPQRTLSRSKSSLAK